MGNNLTVINPATYTEIASIPFHSIDDVKSLTIQSKNAQNNWKNTTIQKRIQLIEKVISYFDSNKDIIALDVTNQMGRPIAHSINEVNGTIFRMKGLCEIAESSLADEVLPEIDGFNRYIKREPLGVVLDIAAWNYPLLIAVNIIVASVLAGNSVLIKHSSITPLCAQHFEDAFKFAGSPEYLVKAVVLSHQNTENLIDSGLIDHVSFTGSVGGGHKIQQSASNQFINVGLELGGKDPAYICDDAQFENALENVMDGAFYNAGQSCCSVERIYVHELLYDRFVENAISWMNNLNVGAPLDPKTTMGAMAQQSSVNTIVSQLEDAKDKGATIHEFTGEIPATGNFMKPAIITKCTHNMEIMMEESFGPVVGIMPVNSDDE